MFSEQLEKFPEMDATTIVEETFEVEDLIYKELFSIKSFFNPDIRQKFMLFYYKYFNPAHFNNNINSMIEHHCQLSNNFHSLPEDLKEKLILESIDVRIDIKENNKDFIKKILKICLKTMRPGVKQIHDWEIEDLNNYITYLKCIKNEDFNNIVSKIDSSMLKQELTIAIITMNKKDMSEWLLKLK